MAAHRKPLRTAWHVAVRSVAVRAAAEAFPHLGPRELGAALGVSRHHVRHYLLDHAKTDPRRTPAWASVFFSACRHLGRGDTTQAALDLRRVAVEIDAAGNLARREP